MAKVYRGMAKGGREDMKKKGVWLHKGRDTSFYHGIRYASCISTTMDKNAEVSLCIAVMVDQEQLKMACSTSVVVLGVVQTHWPRSQTFLVNTFFTVIYQYSS